MISVGWSIPVRLVWLLAVISQSGHRIDLKPANILLMTPKLDEVVMCELVEYPAHLFRFPAVLQPKDIPVPPVRSAPLPYRPDDKLPLFHWATADLGHGTLAQHFLRATNESDILQHTSSEST